MGHLKNFTSKKKKQSQIILIIECKMEPKFFWMYTQTACAVIYIKKEILLSVLLRVSKSKLHNSSLVCIVDIKKCIQLYCYTIPPVIYWIGEL